MKIFSTLKSFWSLLNQDRKSYFYVLAGAMGLLAMLESTAPLLIAAYFKPEMVAKVLGQSGAWLIRDGGVERVQHILPWVIALTFFLKTVFGFFVASRVNRFCFEFQADTGKRVLAAYLNMPFDRFRSIKSGDILRNVFSEPSQITFNISLPFLLFVAEIFVLIAMLLVAFYISPLTILTIMVVFALVISLSHVYTTKSIGKYSRARHDEDASRMLLVNNSILGFLDIRFGNSASLTCTDYYRHASLSAKAEAAQQTISSIPRYSLEVSLVILLLFIIIKDVTLTDSLYIATAFLAIGYRVLPTLTRLATALQLFNYGSLAISTLSDIIFSNQEVIDADLSLHVPTLQEIQLRSVLKSRPDTDKFLFSALDATFKKGFVYAIAGPSGIGKSTLLHVISGMIPTDNGKVTYVTDAGLIEDRKQFSRQIAYLDQSPYIAETRLSQNLLLTDKEMYSRPEVTLYLEKVGLNILANAIQRGEDPHLGRGGMHLSGGEKQRLSFVRALLQNKQLLLLDEPTAGLDKDAEQKFVALLDDVRHKYLTILISHKKEVIEYADEVINLI
jgi:ABC-type multidrug transport system fused ATPase/permease subunit